ncbi:hypothetical protein, partial [Burkholderia mallei]|uniref:hypothetical protein n=1 Tax=Burkholderia mallei TaxID=13373 RepID=UPI001E572D27
ACPTHFSRSCAGGPNDAPTRLTRSTTVKAEPLAPVRGSGFFYGFRAGHCTPAVQRVKETIEI